jgi:pimeloyl-ACP methyl ester carboxylesterase
MATPPNKLSRFWQELKQRNVVRVVTVYSGADNKSAKIEMSKRRILFFLFFLVWNTYNTLSAQVSQYGTINSNIYNSEQINALLESPDCLNGYFSNQTGYLTKIDSAGNESLDTTFTIQQIKIPSDDVSINGWLYLPLGIDRYPLIILTNGGGSITRNIRSFSDWMAPILAHCGIAAFVHDKRGTGESEGIFRNTTYEDYITDAGNCARYFFNHPGIDNEKIGVMGASEGGRIAIVAACRYPEFSFVISHEGAVVSAVDDRIYAIKGWLQSYNLPDSVFNIAFEFHKKSIIAWGSNNPEEMDRVDKEIIEMRNKFRANILPPTRTEMESLPGFDNELPTWQSLKYDYMAELIGFNKKWLAIFGEEDNVVPTDESVENIIHYMELSGNENYNVAVLPDCGHGIINLKTNRIIRINYMIIHWLNDNILNGL